MTRFARLPVRPRYISQVHQRSAPWTVGRTMASTTPGPKFSANSDEARLKEQTESLVGNGWALDKDSMGVEKTFYFKNYTKCLDFVHVIGTRSKSKNHHSKMTIESGSVYIHWTTHYPRGLSQKDVYMAGYCDERAGEIGTVDRSEAQKCGPPPASSQT